MFQQISFCKTSIISGLFFQIRNISAAYFEFRLISSRSHAYKLRESAVLLPQLISTEYSQLGSILK